MSPKKSATSSIIGEYDIELMTEQELRTYIEALQDEHLRMRKARNLYQSDKSELHNFLKSTQESNIGRKGIEMQKDLEMHELMTEAKQKSKFEDMSNKITELENNMKGEKDMLESFINIKYTEILNKKEENDLMKAITEKDFEIHHMEYIFNLILTQLKENNFEKYHKSSKICQNNFEKCVADYSESFMKVVDDFSQNKTEKLHAIWEDTSSTKDNSFADVAEKMGTYFKDIYWKNIKTIEELQLTLIDLKKDLNTIIINLHDINYENNHLQTCIYTPSSPTSSVINSLTFSPDKTKKLEEQIYENYLLTNKLEMLNKEFSDLKEKFMLAMRRIYQKAEFKTLLIEKKLTVLKNSSEIFH